MNEQFETQNPVENTVTPANQMETPTPEAPKKKGNKIAIIAGVVAAVVVAGGVGVFAALWARNLALGYGHGGHVGDQSGGAGKKRAAAQSGCLHYAARAK